MTKDELVAYFENWNDDSLLWLNNPSEIKISRTHYKKFAAKLRGELINHDRARKIIREKCKEEILSVNGFIQKYYKNKINELMFIIVADNSSDVLTANNLAFDDFTRELVSHKVVFARAKLALNKILTEYRLKYVR
jgi:hypothetical protein